MRTHSKKGSDSVQPDRNMFTRIENCDYLHLDNSFKRVNIYPDCGLSFSEWLLNIESQMDTGKRFYASLTGILDAVPDVWKNMSNEMQTQLFNVIQGFYDEF